MPQEDRVVNAKKAIRVLLADDHRLMREGMRGLIEKLLDAEVVAEAEDGIAAVRLAIELLPDLAILDVSMPRLSGIEATRRIVSDAPEVKVLGVSVHTDRRFVEEMLRAGASGFLLKDFAFEELPDAVRVVISGGVYLSPSIVDRLEEACIREEPAAYPLASRVLAEQEREVLRLLVGGLGAEDVAARLCVRPKAVEQIRRQVMSKVGIYTMAGLSRYARQQGLAGSDP